MFTHRSVEALIRETLTIAIETIGANAVRCKCTIRRAINSCFATPLAPLPSGFWVSLGPASQGISGRVFRSGEADIISDARLNSRFRPHR
jgi:hypothetical protein